MKKITIEDYNITLFLSVCVVTVVASLLSYHAYEKKMIAVGKSITRKNSNLMGFSEE